MKAKIILPVLMIVTGVMLLLDNFLNFDFNRAQIVMIIFLIIGLLLFTRAANSESKESWRSGLFFIGAAIILFLMNMKLIPMDDRIGFAALLLLTMMLSIMKILTEGKLSSGSVLYIFLAGWVVFYLISHYYGTLSLTEIREQVRTYWPVALILLGTVLIIKHFRKNGLAKV